MVKIFCILNVCVQLAVIGCCSSRVMHYRDTICSSIPLQINIVYIECKIHNKIQCTVLVLQLVE